MAGVWEYNANQSPFSDSCSVRAELECGEAKIPACVEHLRRKVIVE